MKRFILISLTIMLIALSYLFSQKVFAQAQVAEEIQRPILAATVQIKLLKSLPGDTANMPVEAHNGQARIQYQYAQGLGTLVKHGEQVYIVTHDHWGDLLVRAETVEFRNAAGDVLAEISGLFFRNLIRYRDKGTLLMLAPQELAPHFDQAVQRGNSDEIVSGKLIYFTRQHADQMRVEVVPAQVTAVSDLANVSTYELRSEDGSMVVKGDSGGGIWSDGKLVGNLWWSVVQETIIVGDGSENVTHREATGASGAAAYTESIHNSLDADGTDLLSPGSARYLN
ncbi:MAG: hypothetical protein R3293_15400 [Candidatus Promineifilaceae bacterium]|nr:hypothetical protein [Candidatus Promineifilaceae bacterium]